MLNLSNVKFNVGFYMSSFDSLIQFFHVVKIEANLNQAASFMVNGIFCLPKFATQNWALKSHAKLKDQILKRRKF